MCTTLDATWKIKQCLHINSTTRISASLHIVFNELYFCAGLTPPNKSLLKRTRGIGNRMKSQYSRDGAFLSQTLRKVILTVIVKANIRSKLLVNYSNKAIPRNIIIYFPVSNRRKPWLGSWAWRSRSLTQPMIFLTFDALRSTYTCFKSFLNPLKTLTICSKLYSAPSVVIPGSN